MSRVQETMSHPFVTRDCDGFSGGSGLGSMLPSMTRAIPSPRMRKEKCDEVGSGGVKLVTQPIS